MVYTSGTSFDRRKQHWAFDGLEGVNNEFMTESEAQEIIKDIPVGSKLQIIKANGDIVDATLASQETSGVERKEYGTLEVPALPPALLVQGKRWGVFRLEIADLIKIARVG